MHLWLRHTRFFHSLVKTLQPSLLRWPLLLLIFMGHSVGAAGSGPDLTGEVSAADILAIPDFAQNYQRYQPTETEIEKMQVLNGKYLQVLFGSWCHDSEREIPRLLKLLDVANVEAASVMFVAVDRNKQDLTGLAKRLGLKYTPTIVVFDGDKEVARIIEKPQGSLAKDFARQIGH